MEHEGIQSSRFTSRDASGILLTLNIAFHVVIFEKYCSDHSLKCSGNDGLLFLKHKICRRLCYARRRSSSSLNKVSNCKTIIVELGSWLLRSLPKSPFISVFAFRLTVHFDFPNCLINQYSIILRWRSGVHELPSQYSSSGTQWNSKDQFEHRLQVNHLLFYFIL